MSQLQPSKKPQPIIQILNEEDSSPSAAILDNVLTETIGMALHNAVSAQQNSQMSNTAATTATIARILNAFPDPNSPHNNVPPPTPAPEPREINFSGQLKGEIRKEELEVEQTGEEPSYHFLIDADLSGELSENPIPPLPDEEEDAQ